MRLPDFIYTAACAVLCSLAACSQLSTPGPSSSVTRQEAISIAESYVSLTWTAEARHRMHGTAPDGQRVDTPDAAAAPTIGDTAWWHIGTNQGMPYKWGGFDTPEQFTARLANDTTVYAGDYASKDKIAGGDDAVCRYAAGIDCSGYVSRCWRLERPYSTRELASLCTALPDFSELRPGDILLREGVHVLLFYKWANAERTKLYVFESAGLPHSKCMCTTWSSDSLRKYGYFPYRYKNMR